MTRVHLQNRRLHEIVEAAYGGFHLTVGYSRYASGNLGEIFIDSHKGGTAIDVMLRDSAILVSLALQAGTCAPSSAPWRLTDRLPLCSTRSRRGRHD
jgi:hypothetical protein